MSFCPKKKKKKLTITGRFICAKMAETTPSRTISLISILFLLLTTAPKPTHSLSFSFVQYRTVVSLSHSLMTRVANLRASRGDVSGSRRAHFIAEKLESGLNFGFLGLTWSLGWDYLKNYARRDINYAEMYGVVSDVNELLKSVSELTRTNSDAERATWAGRNYQNVLGVATSLFKKLLKVFAKSGTLREALKVAEREVVQGGLLKDCLELGSNDLKGLLQILKDLASSANANTNTNANDWRDL
ncbi:uncharacterized protein LOC126726352 isoform X2 [Quercus robur]|uniref:uncharacterized protein LOC126726352 isoform X2 n=1 Tax=Quercus robur TaxID=38942 RepID=UPI0021634CC9|nr:uncharacterized protein LOC126726352 isoform X2 [Quercus robur]